MLLVMNGIVVDPPPRFNMLILRKAGVIQMIANRWVKWSVNAVVPRNQFPPPCPTSPSQPPIPLPFSGDNFVLLPSPQDQK